MCDRPAPVSALCPRVEISPVAIVVLALACLKKNNKKNNNNQKMNTLAYMCELAVNYYSEAFC